MKDDDSKAAKSAKESLNFEIYSVNYKLFYELF